MARDTRLEIEGSVYHIISRGQRKNPIFFSKYDMDKYCEIANYALTQYDVEVIAYCLMRNHVHLLIRRKTLDISGFMHRINTIYAMYFNEKYSLCGHVFQGRYKSFIILGEFYYNSVIAYIHDNPIRTHIVKYPYEYAYSSAHIYKMKRKKSTKIKITRFIDENKINKEIESYYNKEEYYVGTEDDYLTINKRNYSRYKQRNPNRRRTKSKNIQISINTLCKQLNINDSILYNKKWNRGIIDKRNILIFSLYNLGFKQSEIAFTLKLSRKTVNSIIKRLQK